jgi:hypothetical protein
MANAIHFRGSREDAKQLVTEFVRTLGGSGSAVAGYARGVFLAIGFAALSDIQADYVRKARGETGEDGVKWPRLSPKTLAYSRRFGPGEKSQLKKAAGLGRANNKRGLLTAAQNKRWKQIYGTRLARFAASMPMGAARAKAAQIAWETLKKEGAKTKLEVYGNRPHEVLRDTGNLLNSLSMGELSGEGAGANYSPPPDQKFQPLADGVIIGTNVPYAGTHQHGDAKRGIPARPFLPADAIPQVWRERWSGVGILAIGSALRQLLVSGSR